ncbi:MAG TPA: hypothetical protein VGD59_02060 [Acidisarcina sp.]
MSSIQVTESRNMVVAAERELAAFLRAAESLAGKDILLQAGDVWVGFVESLDLPAEGFERFFRGISMRAAAELWLCSEEHRPAEGFGSQYALWAELRPYLEG